MCGRIVQADLTEKLVELSDIQRGAGDITNTKSSYNIAPGSKIATLRINDYGDKIWTTLFWGMQPNWMKVKRPVINARAETVSQKPMFRYAFQKWRTVIPVTAYYEWRSVATGKQPYCIKRKDGVPLLLAGLHSGNDCVIITRSAQQEIAFVHDRMPVVLSPQMIHPYLESADVALKLLLLENNNSELDIYPVTRKIGNPAFDTPICLEPIDRE